MESLSSLGALVSEMRRILLYEIALGDPLTEDAALARAVNRAYREVCYYAESPVLAYEFEYPSADVPVLAGHMIDGSRLGLRSVYRAWWRSALESADETDLMDAYYLQPEQDYRHTGAQRVVPDPTKEYRMPYPRVRWLPQRVRPSTEPPTTYAFADGKLVLDSRRSGVIRLIGAFYPTHTGPVRFLQDGASPVTSALPSALNESVLYLAISYWLMPYPDLIELSRYFRSIAFESVAMHANVASSGALVRSPYAVAEQMMGVVGQEMNRRRRSNNENAS